MNKTCAICGLEIPNSENRMQSDIDVWWCDSCEDKMDKGEIGLPPLTDSQQGTLGDMLAERAEFDSIVRNLDR